MNNDDSSGAPSVTRPMIQGYKATAFKRGANGLLGVAFSSTNLATGVQYAIIAPTRADLSKIVAHLFPDQKADESRFQSVEICPGPTP